MIFFLSVFFPSISGERTLQCPPKGLAAWQQKYQHRKSFSIFSCRYSASGDSKQYSKNTRGQPREADSLSRLYRRMAMPSEYISMGPAYSRKGVQIAVRLPAPEVQWGGLDCSAPGTGSGNGTGSSLPVGERGHRTCSSARQGVRFLQPVLHSSQEGWEVASNFGPAALELFSQEIQVQDAHNSYHR